MAATGSLRSIYFESFCLFQLISKTDFPFGKIWVYFFSKKDSTKNTESKREICFWKLAENGKNFHNKYNIKGPLQPFQFWLIIYEHN